MDNKEKKLPAKSNIFTFTTSFAFLAAVIPLFLLHSLDLGFSNNEVFIISILCGFTVYIVMNILGRKRFSAAIPPYARTKPNEQEKSIALANEGISFNPPYIRQAASANIIVLFLLVIISFPMAVVLPALFLNGYFTGDFSMFAPPNNIQNPGDLILALALFSICWVPFIALRLLVTSYRENKFLNKNPEAPCLALSKEGVAIFIGIITSKRIRHNLAANKQFIINLGWDDILAVEINLPASDVGSMGRAFYSLKLKNTAQTENFYNKLYHNRLSIPRSYFYMYQNEILTALNKFAHSPVETVQGSVRAS